MFISMGAVVLTRFGGLTHSKFRHFPSLRSRPGKFTRFRWQSDA
jgi:hypothetical protein